MLASRRVSRGLILITVITALAAIAAGCGSDSSSSSSSSTDSSTTGSSTTGTETASCVPKAPAGLPAGSAPAAQNLTGAAKEAIAGYPLAVKASPWADFEFESKPTYKVGFSTSIPATYPTEVLSGIEAAGEGKISQLIDVVPSTPNDVTQQIQQMRQLLDQNVDVIFALLASPSALDPVIKEAAEQGVPVFAIGGYSTDEHSINMQPNTTQLGYLGAKGLMDATGPESDVLIVQAVPGISYNTQILSAGEAVLEACDTNVVGKVQGNFDPAAAKAATLQFLAGHPGEVDGVFQVTSMASGIISAFEQVGRPVPPIDDINPNAASLLFWQENPDYEGFGVATLPRWTGEYAMKLALAMFDEGRKLQVTDVPFAPPVIEQDSLDEWIEPGWTSATAAQANGPASSLPIDELIDGYTTAP